MRRRLFPRWDLALRSEFSSQSLEAPGRCTLGCQLQKAATPETFPLTRMPVRRSTPSTPLVVDGSIPLRLTRESTHRDSVPPLSQPRESRANSRPPGRKRSRRRWLYAGAAVHGIRRRSGVRQANTISELGLTTLTARSSESAATRLRNLPQTDSRKSA